MPWESAVVLFALLQESIPTLLGLVGSVGQSGRLSGEQLLSDQTLVGEIECVLQHALGRRTLGDDLGCPLECDRLEFGMWHCRVDRPHVECFLRRIVTSQKEDLSGSLLADLPGEQRRPIATVEAGDIGVGLFEDGMLCGCQREVAHNVQRVSSPYSPPGYHCDDDLGHEANQTLYLEDVEPPESSRVDTVAALVLIPVLATNTLVSAGAEGPAAVLWGRSIAGEEDTADIGCHAGVVEGGVQLVNGMGSERISYFGTVEGNTHRTNLASSVVRDVREIEPSDRLPRVWVEDLRDHLISVLQWNEYCSDHMANTPRDIDWISAAAENSPDALALVDDDGTSLTYRELNETVAAAADRLENEGVHSGQVHLVTATHPDTELIVELWATWRVGAAVLLIDAQSPLLGTSSELVERWQRVDAAGTHTVMLTSGTGGRPRPVRLTKANVVAAVAASARRLGNTARDRWLLTLPIFHMGGLSVLWRSAAAGGTVVVHRRFDERRVAAAIRAQEITLASMVPTMLYRLLEFDPGPYHGMRGILLGGAAARRELVERGLEAGLPILQTYGMTEACSQVATVVPGEALESLGSTGPPLDGISVSTGVAGVGEIWVSGPTVSPGYLGEPDREGPYATGDIGYLDENGRLVVLSRVDDMIVTGGENVYPEQVADVLSRSEFIDEIEVIAVPDPEWGQALVAIVVGDSSARDEIERWAHDWLPKHEMPKGWTFVPELPMLPNGKIDRAALSELARR